MFKILLILDNVAGFKFLRLKKSSFKEVKMIFKRKSELMRYAQNMAGHGYIFYTSGTVNYAQKKAEALHVKFAERYNTTINRFAKSRLKARGEANAALSMLPFIDKKTSTKKLYWLLQVTDGEGLAHQLEKLIDIRERKKRLSLTGYELIKLPKKRSEKHSDKPTKPAWTWRYTDEYIKDFKRSIRDVTRMKNGDLTPLIKSIENTLGFHASRIQAFELYKYAQNEFKRSRAGDWPFNLELKLYFFGRYRSPQLLTFDELKNKSSWSLNLDLESFN